jgi:enamine deaminase RidA (YjgF/YER057c/UK114 family)
MIMMLKIRCHHLFAGQAQNVSPLLRHAPVRSAAIIRQIDAPLFRASAEWPIIWAGSERPMGRHRTKEGRVTPEEKLMELGYELAPLTPGANPAMVPGVITGNLLYLSGATPPGRNGKSWAGRVGETYTVEEGYQAARECAVQQLAMAKSILGDLSRIRRVVKVLGMVNCVPGFPDTPKVMHGFSELLYEVLGDAGRHARSAVGMQALPGNAPIEVETIFEIE